MSGYKFEMEDDVKLYDLLTIYGIEIISWLFWIIGFLIIGFFYKEKGQRVNKFDLLKMNVSESKFLFIIISIGFIINMYYLVSLRPMNVLFSIFSQLFFFVGISIGPLLIFASKYLNNKFYTFLGVIVLAASLLGIATRGAFVYTIFYFIFIFIYLFYSKKTIKYLSISIFFLIVLKFTFPDLLGGRVTINENGISLVPQDFSEKQGSRSLLDEIEWRLGAPTRAGTAFLYLYDQRPAGMNPIRNSLLGFMPRSLNQNKPYPSAIDANDQFSLGMYLIMGKLYGTETLMVEFPTGAHFFWEFGFLGVVLLSIISGAYIGICSKFLSSKGLISIPLLFATFKPFGYVDPKIWVSDIAMQIYQLVLPAIFLFGL
ncbi:MAG: hypothetical protein FJX30_05160, partial [Alphaproteobacteria bacterium]|nr:hypothetical protein [Alphaproteobacteria bacterium]